MLTPPRISPQFQILKLFDLIVLLFRNRGLQYAQQSTSEAGNPRGDRHTFTKPALLHVGVARN
jgi:hypothetical protein